MSRNSAQTDFYVPARQATPSVPHSLLDFNRNPSGITPSPESAPAFAPACGLASPLAPIQVATTADPLAVMLREVAASGYRFSTPTPASHQRVLANRARQIAGNAAKALWR